MDPKNNLKDLSLSFLSMEEPLGPCKPVSCDMGYLTSLPQDLI